MMQGISKETYWCSEILTVIFTEIWIGKSPRVDGTKADLSIGGVKKSFISLRE
jgi:hypothetical protein